MLLLDGQGDRRLREGSRRRPGQELHINAPDAFPAELDVAGTGSAIGRRPFVALRTGDDLRGHGTRGALGEDPRFGCAHAGDVTHRIHTRKAGLEGLGIDGYPAIHGHTAYRHHLGSTVFGYPQEQVVGPLAPVVQNGDAARRAQRTHQPIGDEGDTALSEGGEQCLRGRGGGRDRDPERHDEADLAGLAQAARLEIVVQQQRGLARGGWALERCPRDTDDRAASRKGRQYLPQALGAGKGVELVAAFREPGSGRRVVVGTEGDHQQVRVVRPPVGGDASCLRIDCRDGFVAKVHARLQDTAVRDEDGVGWLAAEHHVELGVAEEEGVVPIDQSQLEAIGECLGQYRG